MKNIIAIIVLLLAPASASFAQTDSGTLTIGAIVSSLFMLVWLLAGWCVVAIVLGQAASVCGLGGARYFFGALFLGPFAVVCFAIEWMRDRHTHSEQGVRAKTEQRSTKSLKQALGSYKPKSHEPRPAWQERCEGVE